MDSTQWICIPRGVLGRGLHKGLSYSQVCSEMVSFAAGLQSLGLQQGETVSLFSDNSYRWIIADQGEREEAVHEEV